MMKIAVTAATGGLGSTIINRLKKEVGSENVIGIARVPEKSDSLGVEIRKGDYNNSKEFLEALLGVDCVLLVSSNDHPDFRIKQHRNVIDAARENGVKKIVYTSIFGSSEGNTFSPIVNSNRQTEIDIQNSDMNWSIGRNGIYIEPDLDYLENYKKEGAIINSAADGRCSYTSRSELAQAYSQLILNDNLDKNIYNLFGGAITQQELTEAINKSYELDLKYRSVSVDEYLKTRISEVGEFLGNIIGGIYDGILNGTFEGNSHFTQITNRPHKTVLEMIEVYRRAKCQKK